MSRFGHLLLIVSVPLLTACAGKQHALETRSVLPASAPRTEALVGRPGPDTFLLGDRLRSHYVDAPGSKPDIHAVVLRFDPAEDTLRLHGMRPDYRLDRAEDGQRLVRTADGGGDLIALLPDAPPLDLDAAYVRYAAFDPADIAFRDTPEARQTPYLDGVPHTDRQGRVRFAYDPERSFFPIGLWNAILNAETEVPFDYGLIAEAGYNTILPYVEGPDDAVMAEAARRDLQVILWWRKDRVEPFRRHPNLLAWYLVEEPSLAIGAKAQPAKQREFRERYRAIKAADPGRAVFTLDVPYIERPWWPFWNRLADIPGHDNYPRFGTASRTIENRFGVGKVMTRAVALNRERKPIWWLGQAFESRTSHRNWHMPTGPELRAMTYAAIVHGATGVLQFTLDSHISRPEPVVGIHPDPPRHFGKFGRFDDAEKPVSAALRRRAAALWRAAAALNRELAALAPALLSPTSPEPYAVAVQGEQVSDTPVRCLLKTEPVGAEGSLVLICVNMDFEPQRLRVTFDRPLADLAVPFRIGDTLGPIRDKAALVDTLAGLTARVYRLRLGGSRQTE